MPFSPRWARNCFWWRKSTSVLRFSSACEPDVAAVAAVAAVRAAERDELLATEADAAVAAIAGNDLDFCFVDEFH